MDPRIPTNVAGAESLGAVGVHPMFSTISAGGQARRVVVVPVRTGALQE